MNSDLLNAMKLRVLTVSFSVAQFSEQLVMHVLFWQIGMKMLFYS